MSAEGCKAIIGMSADGFESRDAAEDAAKKLRADLAVEGRYDVDHGNNGYDYALSLKCGGSLGCDNCLITQLKQMNRDFYITKGDCVEQTPIEKV